MNLRAIAQAALDEVASIGGGSAAPIPQNSEFEQKIHRGEKGRFAEKFENFVKPDLMPSGSYGKSLSSGSTKTPLASHGGYGRISDMDFEEVREKLDKLVKGETSLPRFTKEEVRASHGREHGKLWSVIFALESSDMDGGEAEALDRGTGGESSQGGGRLGQLRRVATLYGSDPKRIASEDHEYLDRGAESRVYDEGNGNVLKVRRLDAYDMDGVKYALAKVVYHNFLFPKDAYTLQDVAVWKNEKGTDEYYLLLEQPLVTPKLDSNGNIVEPSQGAILNALKKTGQQFNLTGGYYDNGDTPTDSGSDGAVESAKMVAANGDYAVYDFKPGRNTFIDAETGEVRFIDPRVDINDPTDNFAYSRFGKRSKTGVRKPPADIDLDDIAEQYEEEERFREDAQDSVSRYLAQCAKDAASPPVF